MSYQMNGHEQRQETRVGLELPAEISVGTQLTIQGKLKDISLKSAFITMKSTIYLKVNDEVGFAIRRKAGEEGKYIHGQACVSRVVVGDGMAIYFTKLDDASQKHLNALLKQ